LKPSAEQPLQILGFARNLEVRKERGWVSECYGERKEAPVVVFTVLAKGSEELVTFLLPDAGSVREIEALNGRAFEIESEGRHDVLLLRSSEAPQIETARFASDFDVAWARFDGADSRTPEELILINGHTLQFEGRDLLKSTRKISYMTVMPQVYADEPQSDQSVFIRVDPRLKSKSLCAVLTE
jgi:hypothetical protein